MELAGGGDRSAFPCPYDGACDPPGSGLFAELAQNPHQLGLADRRKQLCRIRSPAGEAHVEWGVVSERETAFGCVELERGDAEVEQDGVHRGVTQLRQPCPEVCIRGVDQGHAVRPWLQSLAGNRQGLGIDVEAGDADVGMGSEDRRGVTAEADRSVDHDHSRTESERGQRFCHEHRLVPTS